MTDQSLAGPGWVPDACTLPTAERPLRQAEFDALLSASVHGGERLAPRHLRVTLAGDEELAGRLRELADRETQCCSFFTFSVDSPAAEVVRLDIEVPDAYTDVLDALQARAALVLGQR